MTAPCTCTYGWSETARRTALLTFDPACPHCQAYSHFGIKEKTVTFDPKMNPNEDGLVYDEWMKLVDRELVRICGLASGDLADGPSYDHWNDGVTPLDYAQVLLVEFNDFPGDLPL